MTSSARRSATQIGALAVATEAEIDLPVDLSHKVSEEGRWRALFVDDARLPLGLLALAALLFQGGLFIQKSWLWTGDIIYHRALMAEILNGESLPGGPYAGLPAFYSPLLHYAAAALAWLFHFDPLDGLKVLSVLAAPCTPLIAYYLGRVLGFDRPTSLIGAFFATFGGGLRLSEDRVWVDALFTGQHNFFPVFPRDVAFLLLPLGFAWTYRAVVDGWRPGAWLAGLAFGLMILVHTQTAVFVAPVLGLYLVFLLAVRRDLLQRILKASLTTGLVALLLSSFWWTSMLAAIVRGGGFDVRMPAYRIPIKLPLSEVPLEFGVFLPFGAIGVLLTLRLLRSERWPAALLLMVWWAAPVLFAIYRPTDFPGGDTFFPRRLWQFSSQPLVLMAAAGLVWLLACGRDLLARAGAGPLQPIFVGVSLLLVGFFAGVPASRATWLRLSDFWNTTSFADVDWDLNGGFHYGAWLAQRARAEGPRTVMVPTPDATMVWYLSGEKLVYVYPTAAIKLAFNVERLTGSGQADRELDQMAAFSGDSNRLLNLARKYSASYVVLRRDGDRLGLVDMPAQAMRGNRKEPKLVETNHYEWLPLGEGDRISFSFESPLDGTATVTLRARRRSAAPRVSSHLIVNGADFPIAEGETPLDEYAEVTRAVPIRVGANDVRFQTSARFELARFVAYTTPMSQLESAFDLVYEDPYTVVFSPR
jgi:hypothetical protein